MKSLVTLALLIIVVSCESTTSTHNHKLHINHAKEAPEKYAPPPGDDDGKFNGHCYGSPAYHCMDCDKEMGRTLVGYCRFVALCQACQEESNDKGGHKS